MSSEVEAATTKDQIEALGIDADAIEVKVKDITGALNIQSVDGEIDDLEDKDDLSLFEEFYTFATGRELPEDGKVLLKELFETEGEAT